MPIPASGGASFTKGALKTIRMARQGCTNRPFYHIVVQEKRWDQQDQCIEQLGTYDPLTNKYNEKLLSLNIERLTYWIGEKALITDPLRKLLGLAGLFPIHPKTYMKAWTERRKTQEEAEMKKAEAKEVS